MRQNYAIKIQTILKWMGKYRIAVASIECDLKRRLKRDEYTKNYSSCSSLLEDEELLDSFESGIIL